MNAEKNVMIIINMNQKVMILLLLLNALLVKMVAQIMEVINIITQD